MNPEELRKLIAEEIGKAVKVEVAEALKPVEAKITEEIGKAVKVEVAEALKPIEAKITDVKVEQARLNAMFEMHIAHTAERISVNRMRSDR